ncbi:MAG: hypothetical protein O3C61_05490 [Proteobacteria bacterium]|nr:hypothetical protein [Pseudomonadota bacterium]
MINKFFLAFIFMMSFINVHHLYALEFSCDFEEVHSNGTVNQGIVLLKKDKLRYEYYDDDLFIIFVEGEQTYLFDKKTNTSKNIKNNLDSIQIIMKLANQFPYIKKDFKEKDTHIKIELNSQNNFIKRISIDSKRARLSLYLKNCILDKTINNIFFKFNPVFEYR